MRRPARLVHRAILVLLGGCAGADTTPELATFDRLQRDVFAKSCAVASCHVGAAAGAGNLSLEGPGAYENLVGRAPTNAVALQAGLKRVVPFKADSSLLYLKLLTRPHASLDLGAAMPVGRDPLTAGQLEYVLQWIASGAPRTGEVANAALLADATPQAGAAFQPLPAPHPDSGVQLRVEPFTVKPDFEREMFVYRRVGNATDLYVRRVHFRMRPFSHHFVAYSFSPFTPAGVYPAPNAVRDIRAADGTLIANNLIAMEYHVFFGGSMLTEFGYEFPPGVALQLPPNAALDLNLHYANHTAAPVTGEAYLNLHTMPASSVVHAAKTLNLANLAISLPPNQRTTIERSFTVAQRTTIVALTSHMHRLGERFVIRIVGGPRDGETVYENASWEHPALVFLTPPIVLAAGEGLKSIVTWNNTTGQTVRFGLQSTDEMAIIFGYYY